MKKRTVTNVQGQIDCLTVKAEAPVRPLLVIVLLRPAFAIASAFDGWRCARTSSLVGSMATERRMEELRRCEKDRSLEVGGD